MGEEMTRRDHAKQQDVRVSAARRAAEETVEDARLGAMRKPYRTPRLRCFGRLVDETQFGGSQVVDSGANLGQVGGDDPFIRNPIERQQR